MRTAFPPPVDWAGVVQTVQSRRLFRNSSPTDSGNLDGWGNPSRTHELRLIKVRHCKYQCKITPLIVSDQMSLRTGQSDRNRVGAWTDVHRKSRNQLDLVAGIQIPTGLFGMMCIRSKHRLAQPVADH